MTTRNPKTRATKKARAVPSRVEELKGGALDAWRTFEKMPKSQQKSVAGISIGIGAGLFLLGAPRLLILVALVPAFAVAAVKAARGIGAGRKLASDEG